MGKIIAIDPGAEKSAWLEYNPETKQIGFKRIDNNEILLSQLYNIDPQDRSFVIEMVASYGMPVGKSVFETVFWIGRFWEAIGDLPKKLIYRQAVKMHLCNSMKAKDSNIRQALIDKFGGSREAAIGTKKKPGPLYGISKDLWSALAIAIIYAETAKDFNARL